MLLFLPWDVLAEWFNNARYAPVVIHIAAILIFLAVGFTITAYLTILYNRFRGNRQDHLQAKIRPQIDELIVQHILANPDIQNQEAADMMELPLEPFQLPLFQKHWARQALIDRIIDYRKNVRGVLGDLLRSLYIQLDLERESFNKMKSRRWEMKVQALNEFTEMDIHIADVNILPLTNNRNRELRAAARHAYIKLSKNEPFKFFDITTEPLLMWDQVELFKIITTTQSIGIPNFARWITYSNNKSVVDFCLKLIVHYKQTEAMPAVIKLLDTKDHFLRAAAINCLGKMRFEPAADQLVYIFSSQPLDCQVEILKALGRMRSAKYMEFLKKEFLYATDFELRKHAAKSIVKNRSLAGPLVDELLQSAGRDNLVILKHVMNPLIKF